MQLNWIELKSRGQGMVEYALIMTLVSIVAISALTELGSTVHDIYIQINNALLNVGS